MDIDKRLFYHSLVFPLFFILCFWLVFLSEWALEADFKNFGVFPHKIKGLIGVITMPFIHADLKHLFANSTAFLVLATLLFSNYRKIAINVFVIIWICSGIILWLIGRYNWHIGASGVVYGIAFFLFFSGVFRKIVHLVATSLVVVFLYGGMIWYMFPIGIDNHISWEGHLSGAIVGSLLAIYYSYKQKLNDIENHQEGDEDDENIDYDWQEELNENSNNKEQ